MSDVTLLVLFAFVAGLATGGFGTAYGLVLAQLIAAGRQNRRSQQQESDQ